MILACNTRNLSKVEVEGLAQRIASRLEAGEPVVAAFCARGLMISSRADAPLLVDELPGFVGTYGEGASLAWISEDIVAASAKDDEARVAAKVSDQLELTSSVGPMNLRGERFGRLLVESEGPRDGRHRQWNCRCDCGNRVVVSQAKLRGQQTHSCGCARKAMLRTFKTRDWRKRPATRSAV